MRISYTMKKERITVIPLCSIKYQAVWMWGHIRVEFESSYEPTGPFGAKSIGEIVINTPAPAIFGAVQNAVGVRERELPITAEKVYCGMKKISNSPNRQMGI